MLHEQIESAQQHLKSGDLQNALEAFQSILTECPDSAEALTGSVYALYHLQRYEEARRTLESNLERFSNAAEAHFLLGSTYFMLRNWYAAMMNYHHAVTLKPTEPLYRLRLYAALQKLGQPELALAELQAAYQLDPQVLGSRGRWKLWRVRIFAGLGPVGWLFVWAYMGFAFTLGGIPSLDRLLDWVGRYLPLASTREGQFLLRAGIMSLPFVLTAVYQWRKGRHHRALWALALWAIWGGVIWLIL